MRSPVIASEGGQNSMSEFVTNCPRCGTVKATFEIGGDRKIVQSGRDRIYEVFGTCRACHRCSIFLARASVPSSTQDAIFDAPGSIAKAGMPLPPWLKFGDFVSVKDTLQRSPPAYLPAPVHACFSEGAACFSIECFNAAAAMFRLCLDLATKGLLPVNDSDGGPNRAQRTRLFDRIEYLLDEKILPAGLRDLADCVREDGNDGAHDGTLTKADAEDLIDFTEALLERVFTEPERLKLAQQRRQARRAD